MANKERIYRLQEDRKKVLTQQMIRIMMESTHILLLVFCDETMERKYGHCYQSTVINSIQKSDCKKVHNKCFHWPEPPLFVTAVNYCKRICQTLT